MDVAVRRDRAHDSGRGPARRTCRDLPGGADLAFGFWVLAHLAWSASRWHLGALPPGCALIGLLLTIAPGSRWVIEVAALTCALLLLQWCRSCLAPSLSAAVGQARHGDVLVRGAAMARRRRGDACASGRGLRSTAVRVRTGVGDDRVARPPSRMPRCGVPVGAALLGSTAVWILPVRWIAGSVATGLTMLLLRASGETHALALAIAFIPLVIAPPEPVLYTASIGTGAVVLYLLGHMTAPRTDRTRSLFRQRIRQLRQ